VVVVVDAELAKIPILLHLVDHLAELVINKQSSHEEQRSLIQRRGGLVMQMAEDLEVQAVEVALVKNPAV
jgi:hypothetical protein